MKEETIFDSLDDAKTPKGKRPTYKQVYVKFEVKRLFFDHSLRPLLVFSGNMKQSTSYLPSWRRQIAYTSSCNTMRCAKNHTK